MEPRITPRVRLILKEHSNVLTIVRMDDLRILGPEGEQELGDRLTELLDRSRNFLLNLSEIVCLSSGALAKLIRFQRQVGEAGGKVRLCGIQPHIHEVFKVTRLNELFDIHEDEQAAIDAF